MAGKRTREESQIDVGSATQDDGIRAIRIAGGGRTIQVDGVNAEKVSDNLKDPLEDLVDGGDAVVAEGFSVVADEDDSSSDEQRDLDKEDTEEAMELALKNLNKAKPTLRYRRRNQYFKCCFCNMKQKDWNIKQLLDHAKGLAKVSTSRSFKANGCHRALVRYILTDPLFEEELGWARINREETLGELGY